LSSSLSKGSVCDLIHLGSFYKPRQTEKTLRCFSQSASFWLSFRLTEYLCKAQNSFMKFSAIPPKLFFSALLCCSAGANGIGCASVEGFDPPSTRYNPSHDHEYEDDTETFSSDDKNDGSAPHGEPSPGTGLDTNTGLDTDTQADDPETGAPSSASSSSSSDTDTGTDIEDPMADFVCNNDLQCALKWFGTICCDKRCINPATNVKHCGGCHNDCMADRRGNSCFLATCACGPVPTVVCQGKAAGDCCTNMFVMWMCQPC
jgi:hypothetical protein